MSRKPKVEAWAVVDTDGSFLVGPSSSRIGLEEEAKQRWPSENFKATKFVPIDPDAARVLKAAEKWTAAQYVDDYKLQDDVNAALLSAVERRQKRGAK